MTSRIISAMRETMRLRPLLLGGGGTVDPEPHLMLICANAPVINNPQHQYNPGPGQGYNLASLPGHPCQMIVRRIARWEIWRMPELLAIRTRQRPKIVIEGVIFFDDDHDVFDWHRNLPPDRVSCGADPRIH